jgi:peptidoglycan/xylan/chitin deacetylase (PgdA/CDA1 family)
MYGLRIVGVVLMGAIQAASAAESVPDRTVVLTFDDGVKSHLTVVAPLLQELGFGATFFITHTWMDDPEHFLSWEDAAAIHEMGFEIGNHSWTHPGFNSPKMAARMAGELALVENALAGVNVPKPVRFAWTGNGFGPACLRALEDWGIRFARRGMQPEVPYGEIVPGPLYDPTRHHPLLIPTGGDAYPEWTLDHFKRVVDRAADGEIVVVQFHGVPDPVHPWVHTPPERFEEYMAYLKEGGFNVIALRDVAPYVDAEQAAADPMRHVRFPEQAAEELQWPEEVVSTRADLPGWLNNMLVHHRYSHAEAAAVCGFSEDELKQKLTEIDLESIENDSTVVKVLPYPGGRHPRIGFLDGAVSPQRGTKVSIFTPWDPTSYVVLDIPEAIFSNLGLIFLAHMHAQTVWNDTGTYIENVDWKKTPDGGLVYERTLPNDIAFGATVTPQAEHVDLEMWLRNGTGVPLTGLRTQVCAMLKGVAGGNAQSNDNKTLESPVAALRLDDGARWVLVAFDHCGNTWANPPCPCMHSDPVFPDAAAGETVRVHGRIWFHEGADIDDEIEGARNLLTP